MPNIINKIIILENKSILLQIKKIQNIDRFELSHASTLISGVIFIFWMSHFYSLGSVGVFGVWITASLLLSQIGVFGFHNAITSYATNNFSTDLSVVKTAHRTGSLWSFLLNVIILVACLSLASQKIIFESNEFALLLVINVSIICQTKLLVARCNVTNNAKIVASANFIKSGSLLFFIIVSFFIDFSSYTQLKVFLFSEITNFLALILLTPKIEVKANQTIRNFSSFEYLRNSFGFAINNFTFDAMTKTDLIMVSLYLPIEVVGIYTIIMNVTEGFLGLAIFKRGQYYDDILSMIKHAQEHSFIEFMKKQYAKFSIIALPIFISGYAYLTLISKAIELQPAIALALNVFGVLFFSPAMLSYNVFLGIKKARILTCFLFSALTLNIISNFLFIPIFGIIGAAFGTFFSFTLLSILINRFILETVKA